MRTQKAIMLYVLGLFSITACNKAIVIEDVNYAQYVESVLEPNEEGIITDYRNSISFSINTVKQEEFSDSSEYSIDEIRLIRNHHGYYFLTANQFKNVYVLEPKRGKLKIVEAIVVSEDGIKNPVFNWRSPYVELISENAEGQHLLTEKGVIKAINEEGES